MNKALKIILSIKIFCAMIPTTKAASLDDIYRDIVRDDNSGYLPIFVKNRNRPELLFNDNLLQKKQENTEKKLHQTKVNLIDERQVKQEAKLLEEENWKKAIEAIKSKKFTAKDLKILDKHVEQKDPKAIEIKAWMLAKGHGIKQDLISSFLLYREAEKLGVQDAKKNAAQVYRAMSREQRENLITTKK